ncbi:hypothetical protein JT358_11550 [Micrococcales bacterium 31B]|nr:hypothetical protein [Micrococcales bacterium 31B]
MSDATYWIDSTDLDARWTLLRRGTTWSAPVSTRRDALVLPQRHGHARVAPVRYDPPPLSFSVALHADTPEGLDAERNALLQLLGQDSITLVRQNGQSRVSARAELVNAGEAIDFLAARRATIPLTLVVPGVFFTGTERTVSVAVTPGVERIVEIPTDSSAPVMDLRVAFTAPLDYLIVRDAHAGGWLQVDRLGLTSTTDVVTVHTGNLTVTRSPAIDLTNRLVRTPGFLGVQPRAGTLRLAIARTKPASSTTGGAVSVVYSPHYF